MEVIIAATKTCRHCAIIEKELDKLHAPYKVMYYEDHPELFDQYRIRRSPVIIVDGKVIFTGMPQIQKPRNYFHRHTAD